MQQWLVSLDTDKVKEYVFVTGRLKEIRGASALLDNLNRQQTESIAGNHGGTLIFAGGGSAMVSFADETMAKEFLGEIEELYPATTGTASITGVIVQFDDSVQDPGDPQSFNSAIQRAAVKLQKAKLSAGRIPSMLLSQPLDVRCERCGMFPATDTANNPGGGIFRVCSSCKAKHDVNPDDPKSATKRFRDHCQISSTKIYVNELGELGSYLGLIYADGNGIGNIIRDKINTHQEMKYFSWALEQAIMKALEVAIKPFIPTGSGKQLLPFLPVLLGGDDVLLITSGKIAMQIATTLCVEFGNQIKTLLEANGSPFIGKPIQAGMSAGVVIAKSSHPLFALEPQAAELLQTAKQLASELKPKYGIQPVIDFRVISSPSANSWAEVRKFEFKIDQRNWGTCRPYPCQPIEGLNRPSMLELLEATRLLRENEFPHNKLHAWQDLLRKTPLRAELDLIVVRSHLTKDQMKFMEDIANLMHLPGAMALFIDGVPTPAEKASPLPDIEEIFEFCEG